MCHPIAGDGYAWPWCRLGGRAGAEELDRARIDKVAKVDTADSTVSEVLLITSSRGGYVTTFMPCIRMPDFGSHVKLVTGDAEN